MKKIVILLSAIFLISSYGCGSSSSTSTTSTTNSGSSSDLPDLQVVSFDAVDSSGNKITSATIQDIIKFKLIVKNIGSKASGKFGAYFIDGAFIIDETGLEINEEKTYTLTKTYTIVEGDMGKTKIFKIGVNRGVEGVNIGDGSTFDDVTFFAEETKDNNIGIADSITVSSATTQTDLPDLIVTKFELLNSSDVSKTSFQIADTIKYYVKLKNIGATTLTTNFDLKIFWHSGTRRIGRITKNIKNDMTPNFVIRGNVTEKTVQFLIDNNFDISAGNTYSVKAKIVITDTNIEKDITNNESNVISVTITN